MRRFVPFRFAALLLALSALPVAGAGDPIATEDVVILFVQGTPVERIIEQIQDSEVEFDLTEGMLAELRVAGLPEELIQAMLARHAELHPAEPEAEPPAVEEADAEPSGPRLTVRLNPEWEPKEDQPRPVIRVYDSVDPEIAERLRLKDDEQAIDQLAIVLFCRTADHVPDHWRGQSPLGRDFVAAPRHRMLAFVPGGEKIDAGKMKNAISKLGMVPGQRDAAPDLKILVLEVPETMEVPLEAGVAHDITLGIAVQIGGRYYLGNWEDRDGIVVEPDSELLLEAVLRSKSKSATEVRIQFLVATEAGGT